MPAGTTALRCHCQFIRFRLNFCLCARKAFAARADCINDIIGQVNHCCIVSLFAVACTALQTPAGMPQGGLEPLRMPPVFRAKAAKYSFVPSRYFCEDGMVEFLMFAPGGGRRNAYPLLVYIPGSGERGSATNQFRQTALFDKVLSPTFQKKHPCFLMAISPPASAMTLLDGLPGRPSKIQNMIADAIERVVSTAVAPAVDRDRIYLAGFSYGGAGVYGLMTSLPEMFAAGVAVSTFPPPPYFVDKPLFVWHVYNEGDYAAKGLRADDLAAFAEAVAIKGGEFRTGTFPENGHDAWRAAWKEDAVWNWLFQKTLARSRKKHFRSDRGGLSAKIGSVSSSSEFKQGCEPFRACDGLAGTHFETLNPARKGDFLQIEFSNIQNRAIACRVGDIRRQRIRHGSALSLCNLAMGAGSCTRSQRGWTSHRRSENPFEKTSCIRSDLGAMDRFRYGVVSG